MDSISIIFTISAILFSSPFLSRYLKMPTPATEIILGTIAAYYGYIEDHYLFENFAHIGFFYLMFMAGTEVDLRMFMKIDNKLLKNGVLYLIFLYILSAISVLYLNMSKILIIIVPTLSVGLILALYKDHGKNARWLNLSMIVGSMGELVSISLLTFAGAALEFGVGIELYKSVAYLVLLLGGIVILFKLLDVLFWWYPQIKTYLMPHLDKEEQDLRLSMGIFSLMIGLMLWLHLEVAFGAFIAGIFIATFFEHKEELPHKIASFGFGFLVPVFFIYIGSTFDLNQLGVSGIITTGLLISMLMIGVRLLSSLAFIKTLHVIDIMRFALSQSMPLTLLIAIATIAHESHSIDDVLYYSLILAALIEVIVSMISIKLITYIRMKLKERK